MKSSPWECFQGERQLDQEYARELFEYRSGELIWKQRPISHFRNYQTWRLWRRRYAGKQAGTLPNHERPKQHRRVTIGGKAYYLSRVIWLYHHGTWPEYCWHKDGNRQNCAVDNLEPLTLEEHLERVENICRAYALRRWSNGKWSRYL